MHQHVGSLWPRREKTLDPDDSSPFRPRYEGNKLMTRFDVTATCGDAYEGVAQVSMCKEPGEPHLDHNIYIDR